MFQSEHRRHHRVTKSRRLPLTPITMFGDREHWNRNASSVPTGTYIPAFQSEQLGLMFRLEHFGTGWIRTVRQRVSI
jgi:hypothetical protein